ncbi:Shikimate kinase [Candidatus Methylomirabilis lanthanidiphila]|uniref:Shikimate kinase n=1 Tax=Candidatus Methylomirabilis lanthanidiphila TaxID=2211376 RepID=A0A564ZGD6_9BACT|nr:shikimate kinase [Candidatus Methylomirabilis lanthanidiphila]VUZ84390.1 Shikimate kinase [Candidatus Methylomirabilis lanthanidiphila]
MKIVLAGFMGTGKSVVGRRLAERLAVPFIDLDVAIEAAAGMTIPEIFASEGEPGFRRREREMIAGVAHRSAGVIATGGGAVVDPENLRNLKNGAVLVCLTAEPAVILHRLGDDAGRPLLQSPDRLTRICELLAQRAPAYAQADLSIDTSGMEIEEIVDRIIVHLGIDRQTQLSPLSLGEG